MKQTALRYGAYSTIVLVGLMALSFALSKTFTYDQLEVFGYLSMLLSMIFVFFGIRHYRNEKNGGFLSFKQGLGLGVLMILLPSVLFGLFDVLYSKVINPSWQTDYTNEYLAQMQKKMTPEKFAVSKKEFLDQLEWFKNPIVHFLLIFLTVFIIGFIVTIISSLALRRKQPDTDTILISNLSR